MVNEKYLATNLEPLKAIGEGKVLKTINNLLNSYNKDIEIPSVLAAYHIRCDYTIVTIYCAFNTKNGIVYRTFEYYPSAEKVEDDLKITAEYGLGVHYVEVERYMELRDFYKESLKIKAV